VEKELTSAMPTVAAGSRGRPIGTSDLLGRSQEQAAGGRGVYGGRGPRTLCDGGAAERGQGEGRRKRNLGLRRRGVRMKDRTDWIDRKMSRMLGRVGPGWPFFDHAPCTILQFSKWVYSFFLKKMGIYLCYICFRDKERETTKKKSYPFKYK
jgi:hypothetical protein